MVSSTYPWTTHQFLLVVFVFIQSPIFCYRLPTEHPGILRPGCSWTSGTTGLECFIRTLNPEFWNYNFSLDQRQRSTSLSIKCSDKLLFESSFLYMNSSRLFSQFLTQLTLLQSLSFDSCKIRIISPGIWNSSNISSHLRNLKISTRNGDWSPSIGLELDSTSFLGLTKLENLDLSFSNIMNIPINSICSDISGLLRLNLSSNRLIELPDDFSSPSCAFIQLHTLDLSRNRIRRIGGHDLLKLSTLSQLRLEDNVIEELEDEGFSNLDQLRYLHLSSNRLVALPPTIFKFNPILRELYLQNNSLTALSPSVFSGLNHLVVLDLSKNGLSSLWIKESVFSGLKNLIILRLSYNQLVYIDDLLLNHLSNLQILHLDNNRIEDIGPEAFSKLTNLQLLDLSRNRLLSINSQLLTAPGVSLKSLYMDHNRLTTLPDTLFYNCSNLTDLGLAGNQLTQVPTSLKTGLRALRTLDLGENRITLTTNFTFEGLDELYGLRLVDNRLVSLPAEFCSSLGRLRVLNLAQNRLTTVSGSAFIGCPEVRALRLDTNLLEELPRALPTQLPSLLWLNVSENRIRQVDYNFLPRSVEWFDLSHNRLESIGGESGTEKLLRNPIPSAAFHLRVLDVSYNHLTHLDSSTIPPSLETLRFSHNGLRLLAPDTFSRSTQLRRLELIGNQLQTIPLSALTFPTIPHSRPLPEIYLAGNPFRCDCTMEWLNRLNQIQFTILRQHPKLMDPEGVRCQLGSNETLRLALPEVKSSEFLCSYSSHCFPLCGCCEFDACDCQMTCPFNCTCLHDSNWSINIVQCSNRGYISLPSQIPMEATELYLDGNHISEFGSHGFIGKKNLRVLHLNSTRLGGTLRNKTFNGLKSLEILHLEDNVLTQLGGWEFIDTENLRDLYLQNNRLQSISRETFRSLKYLRILRLDRNFLVDLNIQELLSGNGYLTSLMLAENPWSCNCEFLGGFRKWVSSHSSIVIDYSLAKCQDHGSRNIAGDENESDNDFPSTQFDFNSICSDDDKLASSPELIGFGTTRNSDPFNLETNENQSIQTSDSFDLETSNLWAIGLSSGIGMILILVLIYLCRKEIGSCCSLPSRILIGGKKNSSQETSSRIRVNNNSSQNPIGDRDDESLEKLFDAYFIYNSEDEDLLTTKLIPELELLEQDKRTTSGNRFYRICLHRDLTAGLESPWNPQMVLSASESSHRILIILSRTFLLMEWTSNPEFRLALTTLLSQRHLLNKLIFIFLPPLTPDSIPSLMSAFPELGCLIQDQFPAFLEWNDPGFSTKLRRSLPKPTGSESSQGNHQRWSSINSILNYSHQVPPPPPHWAYLNFPPRDGHNDISKIESDSQFWSPHQHHHHHHCHQTRSMVLHPSLLEGQLLSHATPQPPPHIFHSHSHEHQNSVSTISNTYPPLTEQNLSDSSNTIGSLGLNESEEHLYSTLDTPLHSPKSAEGQLNQPPSPTGQGLVFV